MKRSHDIVTTRSETARARARFSPAVPPDALLALLNDADITVGQLLASSAAVASLTADMVTRKDDSVKLAFGDVGAARAALVHSTKRVARSARRRSRLNYKRADVYAELLIATARQLRVWGSPALAQECVLEDVAAGCSLTFVCALVHVHTVAVAFSGIGDHILEFCTWICAVTGDGLRVVSAAGPGLKWFEPHSRNEFSVVLAQVDGSEPMWLTTCDVGITAIASSGGASSGTGESTTTACIVSVLHGTVRLVYGLNGGLTDETSEVELQLRVCGVLVAYAADDGVWRVRVPRKPLGGHECAAVGTHVCTLAVSKGPKADIAVSSDEKWLVVGLWVEGTLTVYSLPECELVRTFGGEGDELLQFEGRFCFSPNGNLIVVEQDNPRLQEVTLTGALVRFIGVGEFGDGDPCCVAVHDDVIAVGCGWGADPPVVLFDFATGQVTSRFGEVGTAPGQLSNYCTGIRFTPVGSHVIVAECDAKRLALFTNSGVFVTYVGVGVLGEGWNEVAQTATGEYVVADSNNHRVCMFSPDGSELVRSWGSSGPGDGQFNHPCAIAVAGRYLYVADESSRVQVFE